MQQAASDEQRDHDAIVRFTDLKACQEGHKLVLGIYKIAKTFPADEQFALSGQVGRAAFSITSNIAEGFSRNTKADKIHFYTMARGSLTEIQNQLLIARDVGYISQKVLQNIANQTITVHKLLTGLMKSLREGRGVKA